MKNEKKPRKTDGLIAFKQRQQKEKAESVIKAIAKIKRWLQQGKVKKITVSDVAREAKVSLATIYNNPALLEQVRQAEALFQRKEDKLTINSACTSNSQTQHLQERIERAKAEIALLKKEKALLVGQLEQKIIECLDWKNRYYSMADKLNIVVPFNTPHTKKP